MTERTFDINCDLGVHGDGPNAVAAAHAVRRAVTETGREIATVGAAA